MHLPYFVYLLFSALLTTCFAQRDPNLLDEIRVEIAGTYETVSIIECQTSASPRPFTIEIRHEWAPLGAAHFISMVESGFYTDVALFRVVKKFLVQTGISGDSRANQNWAVPIEDDPPRGIPFKAGTISFAGSGVDSRTTNIFISYADSDHLGRASWETPIGVVTEGFEEVVEQFYSGYGDQKPFNPDGIDQRKIFVEGNDYVRKEFPEMDFIESCKLTGTWNIHSHSARRTAISAIAALISMAAFISIVFTVAKKKNVRFEA